MRRNRGDERRLRRDLSEVGHEIRSHIDSDGVMRVAADAIQAAVQPRRTNIWLTGGDASAPQRACVSGEATTASPDAAPGGVAECLHRRRSVANDLAGWLATPIVGPRGTLLGAIYVEGNIQSTEQRAYVDAVARETGVGLEIAALYESAVSEKEQTNATVARLRQADEAKTMFLATASHELKTPLTVIQGFAETLRTQDWEEGDRTAALEAMERRAVELSQIVDRILLSSRIETGRAEVDPEATDLAPILAERTGALAAATGREIQAEVDEGLPEAYADPKAITTVVDHLLDNAIKYSPDGGPVQVRATAKDRTIELSIADAGIGMTAAQAAHCFDKFWQADSDDRRRFGGTGIGLYIVDSLVTAMQGTTRVVSSPGEGTTFRISLPRADSTLEHPAAVSDETAGDPSVIREFMRQIGIPERRAS